MEEEQCVVWIRHGGRDGNFEGVLGVWFWVITLHGMRMSVCLKVVFLIIDYYFAGHVRGI